MDAQQRVSGGGRRACTAWPLRCWQGQERCELGPCVLAAAAACPAARAGRGRRHGGGQSATRRATRGWQRQVQAQGRGRAANPQGSQEQGTAASGDLITGAAAKAAALHPAGQRHRQQQQQPHRCSSVCQTTVVAGAAGGGGKRSEDGVWGRMSQGVSQLAPGKRLTAWGCGRGWGRAKGRGQPVRRDRPSRAFGHVRGSAPPALPVRQAPITQPRVRLGAFLLSHPPPALPTPFGHRMAASSRLRSPNLVRNIAIQTLRMHPALHSQHVPFVLRLSPSSLPQLFGRGAFGGMGDDDDMGGFGGGFGGFPFGAFGGMGGMPGVYRGTRRTGTGPHRVQGGGARQPAGLAW